jgi:hypothetical protein
MIGFTVSEVIAGHSRTEFTTTLARTAKAVDQILNGEFSIRNSFIAGSVPIGVAEVLSVSCFVL